PSVTPAGSPVAEFASPAAGQRSPSPSPASQSPGPSQGIPSPQPTPTPKPPSFAVLVDLTSSSSDYTLSIVDEVGGVARQLAARQRTPVHLTLYTDALAGGHKRVIYQSSSNYVWPVAWHSGLLVLAHAVGPFEEDIAKAAPARGNPYSAISYHLVDPTNAYRKVLMGA